MNAYGAGLGIPHPNIEVDARIDRTRLPRSPTMALRMRFERFELDEENALLLCDGKPIDLPPRPFEVLCALARRPGSLLTKNVLLDEVWGHRYVSESVLKTAIGKLRTVLQDDARKPHFIETVPRRGYRFIAAGNVAKGDPAAGSYIELRHPNAPTRLEAAGVTAEQALREIREMLLLLMEQPHEGTALRLASRTISADGPTTR